jgi:hypothetical protein
MIKRDVVTAALNGESVPYTPWHMGFTFEAMEKLKQHFGDELPRKLGNHLYACAAYPGHIDIGNDLFRDFFGVVWDRSEDKDIGIVKDCLLPEPDLAAYRFPSLDDVKRHQENEEFGFFSSRWTIQGIRPGIFIIRARVDNARHGESADGLNHQS